MIKKLSSIIFAFALLINNVLAIEADIFVQSTVNRASQLLSENISKEEKIEKLKLIAKDTVDIEGIGFYTLGSARKDLNDNQKKEYSVKFEEYFLKSFSSRLAEYTNPEIDVFNKEVLNENYTIVNSILSVLLYELQALESESVITMSLTSLNTNCRL
jgi:phospholipid transport system substrate-binding protein